MENTTYQRKKPRFRSESPESLRPFGKIPLRTVITVNYKF